VEAADVAQEGAPVAPEPDPEAGQPVETHEDE
jgi:hypothetical protein